MYSKMTQSSSQNQTSSSFNQYTSVDLLGKLTGTLQNAGIGEGFENLISGFKNMLPNKKDFIITKFVDAVMEGNEIGNEDLLTLDPKNPKGTVAKKQPFTEAIVFVIGGGNYSEYHNLMDYAAVFLC